MITIQDSDLAYFDFSSRWDTAEDEHYDSGDAHTSKSTGDTVTITFPGKYIQLLGAKKPSYGGYEITLDGQSVFTGNATSKLDLYHQSLFMRDNLPDKDHKMVVRNLGQGLDVDAIIIERTKNAMGSAAVVVGGLLATFVILGLCGLGIFLYRRHRRRYRPEFDMVNDSDANTLFSMDAHEQDAKEKGSLEIDTKGNRLPAYYLDLENPPRAYLRGDKPRPGAPHLKTLRLKPEQQVVGHNRATSDASSSSSITIHVSDTEKSDPGEKKSHGHDLDLYTYQPNILAYSARTHDESRLGAGRIDLHKREPEEKRGLRPLSILGASKLANLTKTKNRRLSAQQSIPGTVPNNNHNSKTKEKRVSIPVGSPVVFTRVPSSKNSELGPNGERLSSPISANLSPDPFEDDDFDARRKSSGLLAFMGGQSARYHTVESGAAAAPSSPVLRQKRFSIVDAQLSPSLMPKFAKRISQVPEERSSALYAPKSPLAPPPPRGRSRSVTPDQGARNEPVPASTSTASSNAKSRPTPIHSPIKAHTPAQTRDRAPKSPSVKTQREDGREHVPASVTAVPAAPSAPAVSTTPSAADKAKERRNMTVVGNGTKAGGGTGIGGNSSILNAAVAKGKVTREEVECATGIVLTPYLEDYR